MDGKPQSRMQYVNTGEVFAGGGEIRLNSGAIGSCVVITAFDPIQHVGAMAHVMLPGTYPLNMPLHDTRYAAAAIEEMLNQLKKLGAQAKNIGICLVGGANVLKRENDTIGIDNLASVEKILKSKQLQINARSTGGFERRTVLFNILKGCIYYTVGDAPQKILWQNSTPSTNLLQ